MRTQWADIAKGIGIVLVVAGHYFPAESPSYWSALRSTIYAFHMPLFFVIAGYFCKEARLAEFRSLVWRKTKRLLVPFLSVAILMACIKAVAGIFVGLENPLTISAAFNLLVDPVNSYAPLLWFVYVLFLIYCIFPLAYAFCRGRAVLLLALSAIAALVPLPDLAIVNRVIESFPYFVAGFVLANSMPKLFADINPFRGLVISFMLFACARWASSITDASFFLTWPLIGGGGGALMCIFLARCLEGRARYLEQLGKLSMGIYILHTPFEGVVRVLWRQFYGSAGEGYVFLIGAISAIAVGILVPALLEVFVLRRLHVTRVMLLGLPAKNRVQSALI